MRLLDEILVSQAGSSQAPCGPTIQLLAGDLAALPPEHAVDLLVVSAFPDDYIPTPGSLIGALDRAGLSVAKLAERKAVDLRQFASCWLSEPLPPPGLSVRLPVRRLLCFEPAVRGRAPELVGDVFRSIVPFLTDHPPIRSVALPLLASGDQGEPKEAMLESILTAALHWLEAGLALDTIKIVLREASATPSLLAVFRRIKDAHHTAQQEASRGFDYDLFISYAHKDQEPVDDLLTNLRLLMPQSRLFLDRLELNPGAAWQQHIFEALDSSRRVLCCLSPHYLASKVCIEEFNIAMIRSRNDENCDLIPLYLRSASLPTYMTLFQFEDAREGESQRLQHCAQRLANVVR